MENIKEKYANIKIGEKMELLKPKEVVVVSTNLVSVPEYGNKVEIICQYDKGKEIHLSRIKHEKDGKIVTAGTWFKLDDNGTLNYSTTLAHLLRFLKIEDVASLVGKKLQTVDDSGYLVIKAY